MMPPFVVFPTNRIAHFVEVSLYLFYLAQRVNLEVLLECPSLKLVCYVAKNETEETILKMLEEKGIIIVQKEWEFVDQLEQLKIKNRR